MKTVYRLYFLFFSVAAGIAQQTSKPLPAAPPHKVDKGSAYYHYAMAHMYEDQWSVYARSDLASKAIDEYRLAIESDPDSEYLNSGLAELYAKTGRIRDAVQEAQDILKRDPNNLEAHKLLGRIYLRSLGDMQSGTGSDSVLKAAIDQYEQILKLEPDNADDHLLLGRLYSLNKDLRKAEIEFKAAIKLQPESEEAITTLALLYNDEGDARRAAETLSSVPDSARSGKLYSALGYTYQQQKEYKKAIDAYKHAIELDRDNLDAIRGLAQNLMNDNQPDAALAQYKIVAEANPEDATTYIRIAEIYRRKGKFDLALENLKKAGSMVQDSAEVSYSTAVVYEAEGHYDEAAQIMRDLLKKGEKAENSYTQEEKDRRSVFLERLGIVQRENNNDAGALETFRLMLSLGDENAARGYQEIIDTYREAKQWPQATDAAKEAVEKLPKDHDLKLAYAEQLADVGQADAGLQQVKGMLKGTSEDRDIYLTLTQMYSRLRRWQDADAALSRAEQLSTKPEEKQYIYFLRGSVYERQKQYGPAEDMFRKVLAGNPQDASTLNYLGYMLADRDMKLDEAYTLIKKAVDLDPTNGAYLDSLGWAYFKLGKYDQAEDSLTKASHLQRMGSDPTVQEHLGDLYQKTGRLKLAAAHWQRAIEEWNKTVAADVDQDEVAKVQKKLESARVRLAKQDPAQK